MSRLDHERIRAVAVDLPGWGSSDAPPDDGPVIHHEVAAVENVVMSAIGQPVHLVAHSHGGTVALVTAISARIRLHSLTLFEALPLAALTGRDDLLDEMRTCFVSHMRTGSYSTRCPGSGWSARQKVGCAG
jgi:pimeloyl-ACP methyl ester carboxylesterase